MEANCFFHIAFFGRIGDLLEEKQRGKFSPACNLHNYIWIFIAGRIDTSEFCIFCAGVSTIAALALLVDVKSTQVCDVEWWSGFFYGMGK
jgi:hypothetical protein